jgi:hypothetical protein
MKAIKKAQVGALLRQLAKTAVKKAPKKITRFSSEAEKIAAGQKPNLQKAKESVKSLDDSKVLGSKKSYSKKGLEMAVERRTNPEAAKKKMTKAQREQFDLERSYYQNGGKVDKAKDGKWMQKAAASIKKRGTAGKCTPITKPGCTGKAKALAKTFKKIAKSNKKK